MKILFNLECTQPSGSGKRHGGGIYGEVVLRKLIDLDADLVVYYDSSRWLNPEIKKLIEGNGKQLVDLKEKSLEEIIAVYKPDTLYTPLITPGFEELEVERKIGTLHGLRILERPHDPLQRRFKRESRRAILTNLAEVLIPNRVFKKRRDIMARCFGIDVITVSEHSAYSIKTFFPELGSREIKVFYSPSTTIDMDLRPEKVAAYPYYLMVSGNRWDKNVLRAIMAFEKLFDAEILREHKVHITGLKSLDDLKYKFRHPERFKALGYVDDDELQRQYRDAYGFIYPSLNEGFGYPPLEAMRFGVPVAASAVCSIPEVCGEAVLYFNPMDIPEIANRILQLTDPAIRERLHKAGLKRYDLITARQHEDLEKLARYIMGESYASKKEVSD